MSRGQETRPGGAAHGASPHHQRLPAGDDTAEAEPGDTADAERGAWREREVPAGNGAEGEGDAASGAGPQPPGGFDHGAEMEPEFGAEGPEGEEELLGDLLKGRMFQAIFAPNGNINTGSVSGGQSVYDRGPGRDSPGQPVESHEGPISSREILEARNGFAEPDWFPEALRELGSHLLFLVGAPGAGRRTAALNLLHQHTSSMAIRAVDSGVDLSNWQPSESETRGYLVDGHTPPHPLQKWMIGQLRSRLAESHASMVVVLPDAPELVGTLRRELHLSPSLCEPPPPRRVFDARFEAAVPEPRRRQRLLAALEPGLLDELLDYRLVPAQVAELVKEVAEETSDSTALRDRLSFLAEEEVPDLVEKLRTDPDGLAFLLSAAVFEGLDHRTVREEADRLLQLAGDRLHAVLPGDGKGEEPRQNPRFVFRRRMSELVRAIGARPLGDETGQTAPVYGYGHTAEPVRFIRHDQGEAVLRHVWREYGQLSTLMTDWLTGVSPRDELTRPAGRVMGMAARWGGGRTALNHLGTFARAERRATRQTAAYALAVAAGELPTEVKDLLWRWSGAKSPRLRSTVAYTCVTDFGLSRPGHALRLLARVSPERSDDARGETAVRVAVRGALLALSTSGNQEAVLRELAKWSEGSGGQAELALNAFSGLLMDVHWIGQRLLETDQRIPETQEFAELIIDLTVRALDDDGAFTATRTRLLQWCRMAVWDDARRRPLEILLSALAQRMHYGVFRLFVHLDRHPEPLAGKEIAAHALTVWRGGAHPSGTGHTDRAHHTQAHPGGTA